MMHLQPSTAEPMQRVVAAPFGSSRTEARTAAVDARGLFKCYGKGESQHHALVDVNVKIERGEIVGVLGPNGAGKTTLVSILEGLIAADTGTAQVLGEDVAQRGALGRIKSRLGVSMQNTVLPPLLQVSELLEFKRSLHARPRSIEDVAGPLGLESKLATRYCHLSGGEQQRVVIAMALIGDPELMFLDEPTSQLDPQARRAVWEQLAEQRRRRDTSILITTHQMEEAERLCDRVLVLDRGRVIAQGTPRDLIATHCPERCVEFATRGDFDIRTLAGAEHIEKRSDGMLSVRIRDVQIDRALGEIVERQRRGELVAEDLRVTSQSLEDVFIKLTGRGIRA